MTEGTLTGLCRLTIRMPDRTMDIAVPADIPVADLLPAVLRFAGSDTEEAGVEHGGWALQRLGGAPLEDEASLDSADLHDGETLYLRPREQALPEAHFDDLVDGIATTMSRHGGDWTEHTARRFLRSLTAGMVGIVFAVVALPGVSVAQQTLAATCCGVLLLAGAATAGRAVGDAATAALLGCSAVPFFALAGWLLPGGPSTGPLALQVLGIRLLSAGAAAAGCGVLALAAIGSAPALFAAVSTVSVFGAVAGALIAGYSLTGAEAAALVSLFAVALGGFVPVLAFRLSGMQMRPLPTTPQQLQEGIDPYPSATVSSQSAVADTWMTFLYTAVGIVCAACVIPLTMHDGLAETVIASVLSVLLLLHGRNLGSTRQRVAVLLPGVWAASLLALASATDTRTGSRLVAIAVLVALAAVLAIAIWVVPGRRMVPYWGRAAELLHSVTAISLLPLVLWVLGVYGYLRGLTGS
ncbi:type VII secretion integral membrane protein EccD [Streptomyces sp. NPDC056707]|uniref:type VII secretion integral membrane protein EccD n=1 Tax=Streptomyces sp. NPDC056707 TaxID=3345919 RepID=UPI00369DDE42